MLRNKRIMKSILAQCIVLVAVLGVIGAVSIIGAPSLLRSTCVQVLGMVLFLYGRQIGARESKRSSLIAGVVVGNALFEALASRCKDKDEARALYEKYMDKVDITKVCKEMDAKGL